MLGGGPSLIEETCVCFELCNAELYIMGAARIKSACGVNVRADKSPRSVGLVFNVNCLAHCAALFEESGFIFEKNRDQVIIKPIHTTEVFFAFEE